MGCCEQREIITVDAWCDGDQFHTRGPYTVLISAGCCTAILDGDYRQDLGRLPMEFHDPSIPQRRVPVLIPALVESHAHLFLDGDELDPVARQAHLDQSRAALMNHALANLRRYHDAGITVIRDAGDVHLINCAVREPASRLGVRVVAAGSGLRRPGRYGSFLAHGIGPQTTDETVSWLLNVPVDMIKIVLTGVIDFAQGRVKGRPQFDIEETRGIVAMAHAGGRRTLAHCSGKRGLDVAVAGGVDAIEHGFFMTPDHIAAMADKGIAWTPTFIPVSFQRHNPQYGNWDAKAVDHLERILDQHASMLRLAHERGVTILAGSDAGSFGVAHVGGLFDEMALLHAAGLPPQSVIQAATLAPRRHCDLDAKHFAPGSRLGYCLPDRCRMPWLFTALGLD